MYKNTFELQVMVNGRPVKESSFKGKTFIEARRGTQYTLKLKNNSHRRALAVFSVDGVDVLKGNRAEEASSGYVVESYSSIEIKGFRVDDENVSAFKFDDKKQSYANKIGAKSSSGKMDKTSKNCGVIGVRITLEKEQPEITYSPVTINPIVIQPYRQPDPWPYPDPLPWKPYYPRPIWTCNTLPVGSGCAAFGNMTRSVSNAGPMGLVGSSGTEGDSGTSCCDFSSVTANYSSVAPEVPNLNLGTSWGEKIEDSVTSVSFEKSNETFDITIFYGERNELEKFGVDFSTKKKVFDEKWPKAFGKTEYCPIPNFK